MIQIEYHHIRMRGGIEDTGPEPVVRHLNFIARLIERERFFERVGKALVAVHDQHPGDTPHFPKRMGHVA